MVSLVCAVISARPCIPLPLGCPPPIHHPLRVVHRKPKAKRKMQKRKTKAEKELDAEIDRLYREHCDGIQIDIMSVPSIFAEARKARAEGRDMKEAILNYVNTIRKN
jgi:hypothetical protein